MNKTKDLFANINFAILGLVIMATSTALIDLIGVIKSIALVLWMNLSIQTIGWLLVIFSMYNLQGTRKEYSKGFYLSIIGIILLALGAFFMFREYKLFGVIGFTSIYGMFFKYLSELAMFGIYYLMTVAQCQQMAKNKIKLDYKKIIKRTKLWIILALVAMMFVPFAYIFNRPVNFILVVIFVGAGVFLKFYMLMFMNKKYDK